MSLKTDFDGAWKHALRRLFRHFMGQMFPHAHARIDWTRGAAFLDKELERAVRDTPFAKLRADKLVRVYLKDGAEQWILIHVEVQNQRDPLFTARMYVYNYRIYDRYGRPVASFAVLTDEHREWRPDAFELETLGCTAALRFPMAKLIDFKDKAGELERSSNPFALVILAHLQTQATRNDVEKRALFKRKLYRLAYRSGFKKREILDLLLTIDWLMVLPDDVERKLEPELAKLEEEKPMEFKNYYERRGEKKGLKEGRLENARETVIDALRARFGKAPSEAQKHIREIENLSMLKSLLRRAIKCESLEDFKHELPR